MIINEFLDTMLKSPDSLRTFLTELLKREEITTKLIELIKPELTKEVSDRIKHLEQQVDNLEQYSRRPCLKFAGIPENKDEVTDDLILDVINNKILTNTEYKLNKTNIERSHRIGKRGKYNRDIIVKFVSYRDRALVFKNKKNLKEYNTTNKTNLYVNEALTQRRALLYKSARELHKKKLISNCWTYDGKIYVRPLDQDNAIIINNDDDLLIATNKYKMFPDFNISPTWFNHLSIPACKLSLTCNWRTRPINSILNHKIC